MMEASVLAKVERSAAEREEDSRASTPESADVTLGTVEVGLFETSASFERARAVVSDVGRFVRAARGLAPTSPALRVEPSEKRTELSFHVRPLRWQRRTPLRWCVADGTGHYHVTLIVERTMPIASLAIFLIPVLFALRHIVAELGNVGSALLATLPGVGALLLERVAPAGKWRIGVVNWCVAAVALLLLHPVARMTLRHRIAVVVPQDDARIVGGARLEPGTIRAVFREDGGIPETEGGCSWANGHPDGCFSKRPFLSPVDRMLDVLDGAFGLPVTRLRCHDDVATVKALGPSPHNPDARCPAASSLALSTTPRPEAVGLCTIPIREAAERCDLSLGVADAWLAFDSFFARARPTDHAKKGRPGLECGVHGDAGAVSCELTEASGVALAWDQTRIASVELGDLCSQADSVCAVRSRETGQLADAPLPVGAPFRISATSENGAMGQAVCSTSQSLQKAWIELVDDAQWIRRFSVLDATNQEIMRCAPVAGSPFVVLLPEGGEAGNSVLVAATDEPSSQTVLPFQHAITIDLHGGERTWAATVKKKTLQYARLSRLGRCPPQRSPLELGNSDIDTVSKSAVGGIRTVLLAAASRSTDPAPPGRPAPGKARCGLLTTIATLPFALDCATAKALDNYKEQTSTEEPIPWCARSSAQR